MAIFDTPVDDSAFGVDRRVPAVQVARFPEPATPRARISPPGLLRLIRPKQWVKNGFVLAPLVFARRFDDPHAVFAALAAALLFSLAASSVYVLNDFVDVRHDRRHPQKRQTRPLASGEVTFRQAAVLLAVLLLGVGAGTSRLPALAPAVVAYLLVNVAYSLWLKHVPVVDLFCIALGFVLRVWGGAAAVAAPLSSWMMVTTLCLALYLAAIKRRQELSSNGTESRRVLTSYSVALLDRYAEMSAIGAIVFYGLYAMEVRPALGMTVPLVIFGVFRYWLFVERHEGGESPTDALWTDLPLALTVLVWAAMSVFIMSRPDV